MKRILMLRDAVLAQLVELGLGQLLVALKNDLAGGLVDDVRGGDLADQLGDLDRQALDVRVLELLDGELGELAVLLDQDLARVRVADVARGALAGQQIVLDRLRVLLARLEEHRFGVVVVVEQILGGVAEGAQQHRRVQLAPTVDAHVEQILGVELEVEPRAAVGDHARAVEQLARAVGLALVVIVEDAGAAVQLADHDALGAVDDEGTVVGHERDLAEEDLLLLDVADRLRSGVLVGVPDDQAHGHLDRRRERHAALAALVDVVLRLVERVADELDGRGLREVLDREDALEHALKTDVLALLDRHVLLQKLLVALLLDVDEVRDIDDLADLGEALACSEIVLNLGRHVRSPSPLVTTNSARNPEQSRLAPAGHSARLRRTNVPGEWISDCRRAVDAVLSTADVPT